MQTCITNSAMTVRHISLLYLTELHQ